MHIVHHLARMFSRKSASSFIRSQRKIERAVRNVIETLERRQMLDGGPYFEGQELQESTTIYDQGGQGWTYTIDWGDGSTEDHTGWDGNSDYTGQADVNLDHSYSDNATAQIIDHWNSDYTVDGQFVSGDSVVWSADILDVQPTATIDGDLNLNDNTITVNLLNQYDPSSVDMQSLHYSYSITGVNGLASSYDDANDPAQMTFPYTPGMVVLGTIWDKDGERSDYSTLNVRPTLNFPDGGTDSTQVTLAWSDVEGNQTAWRLMKSSDGVNYNVVPGISGDTESYVDTDVTPGQTYWYRLRGVGADGGDTAYSFKKKVTVPLAAPTGLNPTGVSDDQANFAWQASSPAPTAYDILMSTDGTNFSFFDEVGADHTTYQATDLPANSTLYFEVQAVTDDSSSAPSDPISVTTASVGAPSGLAATVSSSTQINLAWTDHASDETGFEIDWSTDGTNFQPLDTVDPNTTTYQAKNLAGGTQYTFRVFAIADNGVSDYSNSASGLTKPLAPSGLNATVSNGQVSLKWNDIAGESGFDLQRTGGSTVTIPLGQHVTTYTDTPPSGGGPYTYTITAFDATGDSAVGASVTASIAPAAPTALLTYWNGLTWTNQGLTAQDTYEIQESTDGINFQTVGTVPGNQVYAGNCYWSRPDLDESENYFANFGLFTYRVRAHTANGYSPYSLAPVLSLFDPSQVGMSESDIGYPLDWIRVASPTAVSVVANPYPAQSSVINHVNQQITLEQALLTPTTLWDGVYLPYGTVDVSFAPGTLVNGPGADVVIWDGVSTVASNYDGFQSHVTPAGDRYYDTTNAGEFYGFGNGYTYYDNFDHDIHDELLDLSSLGVPAGASVTTLRMTCYERYFWGVDAITHGITLDAHRAGGHFGQSVGDDASTGGDPSKYVILTNNDYEEHPDGSAKDYDDTTALIPTGTPVDDDLAKITLKTLPHFADGTFSIELSDSTAVRLFKSDGTQLTNLTMDMSNPSSNPYLAGLLTGDVDVWVEGLHADPNFIFKEGYKDSSGIEEARDTIHMTIADWNFVGKSGTPITSVSKDSESLLLSNLNDDPNTPQAGDDVYFKNTIDGLTTNAVSSLTVTSDSIPTDYYTDDFSSDPNVTESTDWGVLYTPADGQDDLTSAQIQALKQSYQINAVHNPDGDAKLTTKGGDQFTRKIAGKQFSYDAASLRQALVDDPTYGTEMGSLFHQMDRFGFKFIVQGLGPHSEGTWTGPVAFYVGSDAPDIATAKAWALDGLRQWAYKSSHTTYADIHAPAGFIEVARAYTRSFFWNDNGSPKIGPNDTSDASILSVAKTLDLLWLLSANASSAAAVDKLRMYDAEKSIAGISLPNIYLKIFADKWRLLPFAGGSTQTQALVNIPGRLGLNHDYWEWEVYPTAHSGNDQWGNPYTQEASGAWQNVDQTHHFAAFFFAGAGWSVQSTLNSTFVLDAALTQSGDLDKIHFNSEFVGPNPGDFRLGVVAWLLGNEYHDNPGQMGSRIEAMLKLSYTDFLNQNNYHPY